MYIRDCIYPCTQWISLKLEMWANAQRDGRPAEYKWRPSVLRRSLAVQCNAAKTWNPLKFAGCPKLTKRSQPLVGRSSLYCKNVWRRYCCLTSFFPIVDTCLNCEDIARQSCAMVRRWWFFASFLRPVFPASRVQQISDLHSKFALRPHHVWKYGWHPICGRWD